MDLSDSGTAALGVCCPDDHVQGAFSMYAKVMCTSILSTPVMEPAYHLIQEIGKGGFSKVYWGEKKVSERGFRPVGIKVMQYEEKNKSRFFNEMGIMMELEHPNIVEFIEAYRYQGQLHIAMELVNGISLYEFSRETVWREDNETELTTIATITKQCLKGLEYIHKEKGYIHRDIKGRNMLINHRGVLKISDFGLATVPALRLEARCGTKRYMAPEVKDDSGRYGTPADIWSLSITVLILHLGKAPTGLPKDYTVVKPEVFMEGVKEDIPGVLLEFIMSCLDMDQLQRPTSTMLLQHPLMNHSQPLYQIGEVVKEIKVQQSA